MQIGKTEATLKSVFLAALVVGVALLILFPPSLVNEAPFWDDKAYINNALIASGRLDPGDARGPFAEERPPLFWWFLTGLYALNAPVEFARLVSPVLTTLGLVAMFLLVSKAFNSISAGFIAALLTINLNYFVQTTSYILTDSFGSVLAFVALLCFSLGLRYGPFLWLSGGLTALSIIARDQNLLLLPVMLLSFALIARTSKIIKISYVGLLGLVGFAALFLRQEVFLQILSDTLTPVVADPLYIPLLSVFAVFSVLAVSKVAEQKNLLSRRPSIEERMLDIFLAVAIMLFLFYPFFIDNIRLGEEFQVEGRGIFSRPIAHSIMVRGDIARSGLDTIQRMIFWLTSIPSLLTIPLLVLSAAGVVMALKNRIPYAKPLLVWLVITIAYIALFTHIEYRFLVPAVPPVAAFAGYAVSRLATKKRLIAVAATAVVIMYCFTPTEAYGLLPSFQTPASIKGWMTLLGLYESSDKWLT
ncbi:MAG: glycosyltransferase family 39 protein, partial [Candidatus Caldarchaeum sp.]|nr:glycosyltransferase family 39 protein [Candidatus Caldarchaeum sp.]